MDFEPYENGAYANSTELEQDFNKARDIGNYKIGASAVYIVSRSSAWSYILRDNLQRARYALQKSLRISCRRSKEMPGISVMTHDGIRVLFSFMTEDELDEFIREFELIEDPSLKSTVASGAPSVPAAPGEL